MALDLSKINLYLEKEKPITLEEIPSFKLEDLKKPEIYKRFLITLANPQYEIEAKIALPFIDSLNKFLEDLSKNFPEEPVLEKYQEIVRYLQFFHLYFQKPLIIKDLFENYLLFALKSNIDLKKELRKLFIFYNYDMSSWVEIRDLIIKSLKENKEKIGSEKIKVRETELDPLIKNWLLDYEPFRKEGGAIDRANYIAKSENFKKLKEEEKKLLIQVLEIYDYLQFNLNWYVAAVENRLVFLPPERIEAIKPQEQLEKPLSQSLPKSSAKPSETFTPFEKKYLEEEEEEEK